MAELRALILYEWKPCPKCGARILLQQKNDRGEVEDQIIPTCNCYGFVIVLPHDHHLIILHADGHILEEIQPNKDVPHRKVEWKDGGSAWV